MLKITGLIFIILCCSMGGTAVSTGLTARVSVIEGTLSLLGRISDRLRHLQPSVYSLLEHLCGSRQYEKLGYPIRCRALIRQGGSFPESWRQAVGESARALGADEAEILASLADVLGCADLESQLAAIAYTRELLRVKLEEARAKERAYGKLYSTLGVLSGIAIVIILL